MIWWTSVQRIFDIPLNLKEFQWLSFISETEIWIFQIISDTVTYKHTDILLRNWGKCLRFGAQGMSFLDTLSSYSRIDFSGIVNAKWSVGYFQIPDQICGEKLQKYNSLKSEMAYEKYIDRGALVISRFLIGSSPCCCQPASRYLCIKLETAVIYPHLTLWSICNRHHTTHCDRICVSEIYLCIQLEKNKMAPWSMHRGTTPHIISF